MQHKCKLFNFTFSQTGEIYGSHLKEKNTVAPQFQQSILKLCYYLNMYKYKIMYEFIFIAKKIRQTIKSI